jgi:hypothetical protein
MKILLVAIFILIALVCWILATKTTEDGKDTELAFIIKSIFYWAAVVLSFGVGLYVA